MFSPRVRPGFIVAWRVELVHGSFRQVAAGDGPLVLLVGKDRSDEADHGRVAGEDPHDVRAALDLLVQSFQRAVALDLAPVDLRERGEGEDVGAGAGEELGGLRESVFEGAGDLVGVPSAKIDRNAAATNSA